MFIAGVGVRLTTFVGGGICDDGGGVSDVEAVGVGETNFERSTDSVCDRAGGGSSMTELLASLVGPASRPSRVCESRDMRASTSEASRGEVVLIVYRDPAQGGRKQEAEEQRDELTERRRRGAGSQK